MHQHDEGQHHDGPSGELEQLVARVPLFAGLDPHQIAEIAQRVRPRMVPRGEQLYGAGELNPFLRIIHSGSVKVYRLTESGHEQVIRVLGPGEFLGERALISPSVSDHFAVTLGESEVCSLHHDDIRDYLLRYPSVAYRMLETLSERLGDTESQVSSITGEDAERRIAGYLLQLAAELGRDRFRLPSTKKDVASYLGVTPETLSRRLARFEAAGWLAQHGGLIELLDAEALRAL